MREPTQRATDGNVLGRKVCAGSEYGEGEGVAAEIDCDCTGQFHTTCTVAHGQGAEYSTCDISQTY